MIIASFNEVPLLDDLLKLVPKLRLVLFDMDGTLVDTEEEHALAVVEVLKKNSSNVIDEKVVHQMVFGCPDPYAYQALKKSYNLHLHLEDFLSQKQIALENILHLNLKNEDAVLIKLQSLVQSIQQCSKKINISVVTASERKTAEAVLSKNYSNVFPLFFGREDTNLSKPYPDPYFNAIDVMGKKHGAFNLDEILILEDSPYGLASAMASGYPILQARWYYKK